jgi:hypothetical protein
MPGVTWNDNARTQPKWAADRLDPNTHLMPFPAKIDPNQFQDGNGIRVQASATTAAAAIALPVVALPGAIPAGTLLQFGDAGENVRVTTAAAKGAVSLVVDPLPQQIESGDVAVYSKYGRKSIASGTLVGRTYTERDANTAFGPADDPDDEFFIVAFDVQDAIENNDIELVRPGTVIKENHLPDWAAIAADAALLAKLRATYRCIKGVD